MLIYKDLRTIIAMITESKVIELFCMADENQPNKQTTSR